MALTYDLTQVKNRDMSDKGLLVTQAVIFHTMTTRIWKVTDENASEHYARIHFCEADLGETMLTRGTDDPEHPQGKYLLTPADIVANIGVTTNVGYEQGRREWIRSVVARRNKWVDQWKDSEYIKEEDLHKYTYAEVRALLSKYADAYLAFREGVAS